jgi:hypothetical protein
MIGVENMASWINNPAMAQFYAPKRLTRHRVRLRLRPERAVQRRGAADRRRGKAS